MRQAKLNYEWIDVPDVREFLDDHEALFRFNIVEIYKEFTKGEIFYNEVDSIFESQANLYSVSKLIQFSTAL